MKKIWIWGISSSGKFLFQYLVDNEYQICGIIDNLPLYKGFQYKNINIYSYSDASNLINKEDEIVICTRKQIFDDLKNVLCIDGFKNVIWIYDFVHFENYTNKLLNKSYEEKLISKICDSHDFEKIEFKEMYEILKSVPKANGNYIVFHRKIWEWCYIALILKELGYLAKGKKGLGFAVGKEPLPALFASYETEILATDLGWNSDIAKQWKKNNENAESSVENLFYSQLCDREIFDGNVVYADADMNDIPQVFQNNEYDFCWSSCAIEHVGSLHQSKEFLKKMINCIRPGGIAIHTTEFNLSSDIETIEHGGNVLWRKSDIEEIKQYFWQNGCTMDVSYNRTDTFENNYVDMPPFEGEGKPCHLNLVIDGYMSTSIALVIHKNDYI